MQPFPGLANFPLGQERHSDALVAPMELVLCPVGHSVHIELPILAYVPLWHVRHTMEPEDKSERFPDSHVWQALCPAKLEYLPGSHGIAFTGLELHRYP